MGLDDAVHGRQPQAEARLLAPGRAIERLEDARRHLGLHADAVVAHLDHHLAIVGARAHLHVRRLLIAEVLARVRQQVAEDVAQQLLVGRELLGQAKEEFGIHPNDEEISSYIRKMRMFAGPDGAFDGERYRTFIERGIGDTSTRSLL